MDPVEEKFVMLRKLLAIKQQEKPPPGYFDNFSGKVIARIQAAENAPAGSFWRWLAGGLEWKTALVGVWALSFISLLVWGIHTGIKTGRQETSKAPAALTPAVATTATDVAGKANENNTALAVSNSTAPDFLFAPPSSRTNPQTLERVDFIPKQ